jgi:nucleoside-diphosphate-sugar epimerase
MSNLVIGSTSQLSQYFPEDFVKVSSRNIDFNFIKSSNWDRIFLCFGESRKNLNDENIYFQINFDLTIRIINEIKSYANKIVVYSTCELWNKYDGQISIDLPFDFYNTPYLNSKYKLTKFLIDNDEFYQNVIIIYPFNFNSIKRSQDFLFGKIFYSIINKKEIEIGDTYFYRDMIHPKLVVSESIKSEKSKIVGSGRLIFVNDFIRDLYKSFNLDYDLMVSEKIYKYKEYSKNKEYYLKSNKCHYIYDELLTDTVKDIKKK